MPSRPATAPAAGNFFEALRTNGSGRTASLAARIHASTESDDTKETAAVKAQGLPGRATTGLTTHAAAKEEWAGLEVGPETTQKNVQSTAVSEVSSGSADFLCSCKCLTAYTRYNDAVAARLSCVIRKYMHPPTYSVGLQSAVIQNALVWTVVLMECACHNVRNLHLHCVILHSKHSQD